MPDKSSATAVPAAQGSERTGSERFAGLDCLRAIASLLVVMLHAGIPYMSAEFPGLIWCIQDNAARSEWVDSLCWKIDTFVMPLFFVMGGFLACHTYLRSCPLTLAKNRLARLGVPFLIGAVVILPVDLYVWLTGWVIDGRIPIQKLRSLKVSPDLRGSLDGVAHLWFLEYLLLFCVGAGVWMWVADRRLKNPKSDLIPFPRSNTGSTRLWKAVGVTLGLFLISAFGLAMNPRVVIGFETTYFPRVANLLYYAPCFASGWQWRKYKPDLPDWSGWLMIGLSMALFGATSPLITSHIASPASGTSLIQLAAAFTACGWLATAGWFTLAVNFQARPWSPLAYLGRASLWVYLVHHPVCGLTQIAMKPLSLNGFAKMSLVATTAVAFCLLTYEAFVRGRWLDRILNGAQRQTADAPIPAQTRIAA